MSLAGAAFNASVDALLAVLNVFFLGRYPKPPFLCIEQSLRGCHFIKVSGVTVAERGMVNSSHLIDGESRQENAMEPITATIVIVALVALAC